MLGQAPLFSKEALAALRRLVQTAHKTGGGMPVELIHLANHMPAACGITIDFTALGVLGAPMIVVHAPASTLHHSSLSGLTPRENQIAALVAAGCSNKQIARRLGITLATVKDHMHRVLGKTQLANRAALAAAYHSNGSVYSSFSNPLIAKVTRK